MYVEHVRFVKQGVCRLGRFIVEYSGELGCWGTIRLKNHEIMELLGQKGL